jgi:hypothetical protein
LRRPDLAHGDVAQSDVADLAFLLKARERADAGLDRRLWVDGVELIEIDRVHG